LTRVLGAACATHAHVRLTRPRVLAGSTVLTFATTVANRAAVTSAVGGTAAFGGAVRVETDVIDTAAATDTAVRAVAALELVAAAVTDRTAILAAHRVASERCAPCRHANAIRARVTRGARTAIERVPATVAHFAAKLRASGLAGSRRGATRATDAEIAFANPTRLATIAAIERLTAAVADLAAIVTAFGAAGHRSCTGGGRGIRQSRRIFLHIELGRTGLGTASGSRDTAGAPGTCDNSRRPRTRHVTHATAD